MKHFTRRDLDNEMFELDNEKPKNMNWIDKILDLFNKNKEDLNDEDKNWFKHKMSEYEDED